MLHKLLQTKVLRSLSERSNFVNWLYVAHEAYWRLKTTYKYPIYIDYPVNAEPRYGYGKPPHQLIHKILRTNSGRYKKVLDEFMLYKEQLKTISLNEPTQVAEPFWNNGFIEGLDSIALYCFPCMLNSRLYIEVGAGNSTKFVKKAIVTNELNTKIISIDPQPRAEIDDLCDELVRNPLESVDVSMFDQMDSGDILMVDNSHRCFQNSDVTVVFLDILPRLKTGVVIYIDDVYLPLDYPRDWRFRYYSEQYLLAVLLIAGSHEYEVLLPCNFMANDEELKRSVNALWEGMGIKGAQRYGNGFWMRKVG